MRYHTGEARTAESLVPGTLIGEGLYILNERTSFMGPRSDFPELPWQERSYLPSPALQSDQTSSELISGPSMHLKAWSAYYSSSFYISSCAGRGAHGEVWRGVTTDPEPVRVVLKRIYAAKGSSSISSAMREVYYGQRTGQHQEFTSRYISHFIEDGDLWLVFRDEGISLYQAVFQPTVVGQLTLMTRSLFWRHLREYSHTVLGHIFRQIFAALQHIHSSLHLVHRDIKLENIFIDVSKSHVRIGDFGSAAPFPNNDTTRVLFPPSGNPSLDEETSRNAPPEAIEDGERSPAFDIWCVGVMWLELWLGSVNIVNDLCIRNPDCQIDLFRNQVKKLDPLGQGFDQDREMLNLVWSLVRFNPLDRPSAKSALGHAFFQKDRFALTTLRQSHRFGISSASSIGSRSQMEDRVFTMKSVSGGVIGCVFDGHNGSQVAETLKEKVEKCVSILPRFNLEIIKSKFFEIVDEADRFEFHDDLVGSTMTCVAITDSGEYFVANIGDSRAITVERTSRWEPAVGARVTWKDGETGEVVEILQGGKIALVIPAQNLNRKKAVKIEHLTLLGEPIRVDQITRDHKPDDPIERKLIESRGGTVVGSSPARVEGVLAVSRSVGASKWKNLIRAEIDIFEGIVGKNVERFVIATDGIWDTLSNYKVGDLLNPGEVIDAAIAAGARDNMAVVFIDIDPEDQCPSD